MHVRQACVSVYCLHARAYVHVYAQTHVCMNACMQAGEIKDLDTMTAYKNRQTLDKNESRPLQPLHNTARKAPISFTFRAPPPPPPPTTHPRL